MKNNMTTGSDIKGTSYKRLVPELRFPDFREGFEWNMDKFYDLFSILSNNTLSRSELSYGTGSVYNIHYGDVLIKFNEYLDVAKEDLPYINDKTKADKYKVAHLKDGDVVIADTAEDETVGKCTEVTNVGDTIVVSGLHTIPCRPQKEFAQAYLGYYMNSTMFHDRLLPIMQGAKVTSIPKSSLQNILLVYPQDLEEQQKISGCLSSIDEEISAIKEKVEQLKAHKKGLMQKLFPVTGKFVPECRFSEFKNDSGWKENELHEIAKHQTAKNKENCKYPVLTNSAIYGIVPQQEYFDRKIVTNDNLVNYQIVEYNDFVYNPRISAESPVGPISRNKICLGIMSPLYTIFRFKEKKVDYFEYYFGTDVWHEFIKKKANYGARFDRINISIDDFFSLPIRCPSSAEQQKIAECLSSIDELISLYENKVTLLEQHKRGLMQQLFPKL